MQDRLIARDSLGAAISASPRLGDLIKPKGLFKATCLDAEGIIVWERSFRNTVVTVGMNIMLDTLFKGSAYSVTGPFMGLISSTSFSAIVAADTMSSHAGWLEAGNADTPTYSGARATLSFASASGGVSALASSASFSITGTGTIKGAFIALGTGAVSTIDSTAGTLFAAGLFAGGDAPVLNTYTVNIGYSLTL